MPIQKTLSAVGHTLVVSGIYSLFRGRGRKKKEVKKAIVDRIISILLKNRK